MKLTDRELGMKRPITRRDFLNGVSVAVGGTLLTSPLARAMGLAQEAGAPYPPSLTGMRGSHDGSWEAAHALRDGESFDDAVDTGERYDLVVVGGGISGLAAAYFYREAAGMDARILVLDNHDDFGGHAKRNEFTHEGRTFIGYGGTQSIDTPSAYSAEAIGLLRKLDIDTQKFYQAFDREALRVARSLPRVLLRRGDLRRGPSRRPASGRRPGRTSPRRRPCRKRRVTTSCGSTRTRSTTCPGSRRRKRKRSSRRRATSTF